MKRELQRMRSIAFLLLVSFWASVSMGQSAGFNTTFVVLSINGGSDIYYDLQADTTNPDFHNANMGTFCGGLNGLVLKGVEHNNYKCGGCDITTTTLHYRVTSVSATPSGFSGASVGLYSDLDNDCGGKDQQWKNSSLNTDLSYGLPVGDYKLDVYSSQETTCSGTQYADNGGAYFTAYFSIGANLTYYRDADNDGFGNYYNSITSCTGTPAGYVSNSTDCNDNQLQYLDTDGDSFGSTTLVACGVINNTDCNDNQWQFLDADGDGFGSNTLVACGVFNSSDCNDNQIQYLDADGDSFGSTTQVACGVTNFIDCNDNQWQYLDSDGDGFGSNTLVACGVLNSTDCNDNQIQYLDVDGDSFGSTTQVACGVTNSIDCNDNQWQYLDSDADGFGSNTLVACGVLNNYDCNDNQIQYLDADGDGFGSETQVACGVFNHIDCNDNQIQYLDSDGDGFGSNTAVACGVTNNYDCNDNQLQYLDADGDGFGSETQVACGVFNHIDCNDNQIQYLDSDGDGFGSNTAVACGVTNNYDCNDNQLQYLDADGDGFGSETQVACGVFNHIDCNDNQVQYLDSDGDGFGSNTAVACGVTNNWDCNDNQLLYLDSDGDGLGSDTFMACSGVLNHGDCDDNNAAIQGAFTFYVDADGDGYGSVTAPPQVMCALDANTPPGANLSPYNTDCNDNDALTIAGPSIAAQPASTFICPTVGATASYTVVTIMSNPTYEWQFRKVTTALPNPAWTTITSTNAGTVYSGYTSDTLNVVKTAALPAVGTEYRVVVTGGCGSITSDVATIAILSKTSAGTISVPTSVCLGNDITFTVTKYSGTSFQWQSAAISTTAAPGEFTDIPGATGASYTIVGATAGIDKSYRVIVTNSCNGSTATSATKTIKVDPVSVAGTITGGGLVCAGSNATIRAAGYVGKIQWQYSKDGSEYIDAPKAADAPLALFGTTSASSTGTSYMVTGIADDLYFRAKITSGACSSAYTDSVHYVIGTAAVVGTVSPNATVCPGTATILALSGATGIVTWQKSTTYTAEVPTWTSIANSNVLSISSGNMVYNTAFRAKVTIGECSTVYSDLVYVSVVAKPVAKPIVKSTTSPTGNTAATALCTIDASKVLTLGAGHVGSIQWQYSTTSTTAGFTDIDGATNASYTIANPAVGANYYRVKMSNNCGAEVFGTAVTVYYKDCPILSMKNSTPFTVIAYPNPYTENFNLSVATSSVETVGVSVYDMTGKLIDKREVRADEVSDLQVGNNFPSGVYNVVVTQGSEVKTLRVIKR